MADKQKKSKPKQAVKAEKPKKKSGKQRQFKKTAGQLKNVTYWEITERDSLW